MTPGIICLARNFEGVQNDCLEKIVYGENIHVREGLASYSDFKEVVIDSIHNVTIPLHETAKFTSAELRGLYHQEARVS